MGSQGFRNIAGNPFVYQEDVRSAAFGLDAAAQTWKIAISATTGALPTSTAQFIIDPATDGNVTIDPNGAGNLVVTSGNVSLTAGNLALPTTSSTVGQVLINASRVFHTYGTENTFVGNAAGNFTLTTGTSKWNVGLGSGGVLDALTTGNKNTCVGYASGSALNSHAECTYVGYAAGLGDAYDWAGTGYNTGIGSQVLSLVSGNGHGTNMTAVGYSALKYQSANAQYGAFFGDSAGSVLKGNHIGNTFIGALSGYVMTGRTYPDHSSKYNTLIGYAAGSAYTTGQYVGNICIGAGVAGTAGENHVIRIGADGTGDSQQDACYIAGVYARTIGATNGVVVIDNAHKLGSLSALTSALGGTGLSTYAQGDILYASATTTLSALAKNTSATRYLSNTGTSNNPAWAQIDLSNGVTGTLPPANGGRLTWSTLTADATAAVNNGYLIKHATPATKLVVTLPATAALYSEIEIDGYTAGLWKLAQNSGQTIHFNSIDTTTGTGGYLEATDKYDSILIRCVTADTEWSVVRSSGSITIV